MLTALLEVYFYLQIPVVINIYIYKYQFYLCKYTYGNTMSAVVVRNSERHSQTDTQQVVKKRYEEAYK